MEGEKDKAAPKPEKSEAAPKPETQGSSVEKEQLVAKAPSYFGKPSHTVAGALSRTDKESLTVPQAEALVEQYLKR